MRLSVNNKLVRWAYWFEDRPNQTSLCNLFWRSILLAPFVLLMAILFVWLWGPVVLYGKYGKQPVDAWFRRREQRAYDYWTEHENDPSPDPSVLTLLWLGLVSIKNKVCPIIRFYPED